ncbi:fad binding domain-containing protein [Stemphylium lycopersici]|uniref:FAD/NAD(P)-binding domain-containing protein n=1 Tax=Stemphylium lycopersici TaxID=183478 RepID=A0A364MVR0_STELY|nr:fad binding domain-containing protein [Stemphylium lycopersici]RAR05067.1 FAD/NAD(P)-binding domain-containing protein [Stemphylium lycopersici]
MPIAQQTQMEVEQRTGIEILVIGGGIGGLAFAIEAYRKGHTVRVIERSAPGQYSGEIIMVTSPALVTPQKWPGFMERARAISGMPSFDMRKFDGTFLKHETVGAEDNLALDVYRRSLHSLLTSYAQEQGIPITFGVKVTEYFENEKKAGVVVEGGDRLTADVVVAADGVGSRSRELMDGNKSAPISSGFVMYRCTYPAEHVSQNPIIGKEFAGRAKLGYLYIGPGAHIVIHQFNGDFCYLLTTKDEHSDATESWSKTTTTFRALEAVKGWDPLVTEVIKASPNNQCLDWKLMWRDPQPQWASKGGRVIQLGDAAHPFLPTSFSGGTMAMEDGYSLAACLSLAGRENVQLATKVHNKLRFERVSCAQKLGFKNREVFHNTDWNNQKAAPKKNAKMVGDWLMCHDPEKYTYDNYHKAAEHLLTGAPFKNTNIPPGYEYKPWTVRELLAASDRGEEVEDEGLWF